MSDPINLDALSGRVGELYADGEPLTLDDATAFLALVNAVETAQACLAAGALRVTPEAARLRAALARFAKARAALARFAPPRQEGDTT